MTILMTTIIWIKQKLGRCYVVSVRLMRIDCRHHVLRIMVAGKRQHYMRHVVTIIISIRDYGWLDAHLWSSGACIQ